MMFSHVTVFAIYIVLKNLGRVREFTFGDIIEVNINNSHSSCEMHFCYIKSIHLLSFMLILDYLLFYEK